MMRQIDANSGFHQHAKVGSIHAFDRAGNILPVDTLGVETATYDATTNRLLRRTTSTGGSVTSSYDRAGNLTQRFDTLSPPVAWAYGYDALERLVSVRRNGTLIARYGYDVQGRRIVKRVYSSVSGGTVGYLRMSYAGSQVAFETDSAGSTLLTQYTWGPGTDQLVSLRVAGTHYVAVTDALGSVRALVKRDGTWAGRLRYDPYGKLVDSAGPQPALRYRWTGREWDAETGFYFHRTRYYDPQAQRFVQEDPIGYAGSGNLYAYVSGDVLQARDPDGLMKRYVIAGGGGWGYMCLGIDACFSGFGDLMNVGGGTWGERQAAGLIAWGAATSAVFDLYDQYEGNYERLKGQAGGPGSRAEVNEMFAGSKALGRRNFDRLIEAVTRGTRWSLGEGDLFGLGVIGSFLNRLLTGVIFLNAKYVERYQSSENVRAMTAVGITVIHKARFFDPGRGVYLANMMVHEELHNMFPDIRERAGGSCAIYAMANYLTSTYVPCPW